MGVDDDPGIGSRRSEPAPFSSSTYMHCEQYFLCCCDLLLLSIARENTAGEQLSHLSTGFVNGSGSLKMMLLNEAISRGCVSMW